MEHPLRDTVRGFWKGDEAARRSSPETVRMRRSTSAAVARCQAGIISPPMTFKVRSGQYKAKTMNNCETTETKRHTQCQLTIGRRGVPRRGSRHQGPTRQFL